MPRRLFVTSALPYANGAIHLGHLVEYIQTDIWARFQRMQGHRVVYICADDTHGTPIMLRAEKEGITPEALIERVWHEHTRDFASFAVAFDLYHSTHSEENKQLSQSLYRSLVKAGLIEVRAIEQMFDPVREMFLPDRFIKGTCPKCDARDQYGDSCEACGATYSPTELKNPVSAVSGATPITRSSDHHFFRLSDPRCLAFLREWAFEPGRLQTEAVNKLKEWLGDVNDAQGGLVDWDISRDAPYFGFEIPEAPGKYFYVWLDAPVGYFAGLHRWCELHGESFEDFVGPDSEVEQIHFIGKDILYFHTLFWPAMLKFSGHRTPTRVFAHGFLTVDGAKMSKSRGTFITAQSYIEEGLNPEWLRYYFASRLNGSMEDLDLSFDDFIAKVNSDLVGKFANIASRCAGFLIKRFEGRLLGDARESEPESDHAALEQLLTDRGPAIAQAYDARDTARMIREVAELMDSVNAYVDLHKPWELAKVSGSEALLHRVLTTALRSFARLAILLKPVLPTMVERVEREVFALPNPLDWHALNHPPVHSVLAFKHLVTRVDRTQIDRLIEVNKSSLQAQS
ncbi:MAG: methionine--tRNA ligase [Betaproteobacteria bacterium]|nr:methionine--tRNA ligase [Betaproteobacteria bacterium]NBT76559.1 methionine--tRNA ligase [Betaproteobacteria bacterium]